MFETKSCISTITPYKKTLPAVSSPADPAVCNDDVSFVSFSVAPLSFNDFKLPPVCGGGVDD